MDTMNEAQLREMARAETARAATPDDARSFAMAAARIACENKAENVCVLDLRGLSTLADFFVIGTGSSNRQMHAVLDRILEHARTVARHHFNISDTSDASWLLADYVDVVVHLFDAQHRDYYDLDGLWGDAPRVDWNQPTEDAAASTSA